MLGYWIFIAVCLYLTSFFAAAEMSYTTVSRVRLENLADDGNRRAKCAVKLRDDLDRTLCTVSLCHDLVKVLSSVLVTVVGLKLLLDETITEGQAYVLPAILTSVVILIFGDIIPKLLAKRYALSHTLILAYPLRVLTCILYPVVHPVSRLMGRIKGISENDETPTITEEELSAIIETAEEEGELDEDKGELLQSALDYQETTVEEILTPRINLTGLPLDATAEEVREVCDTTPYSRLLIYDDTIDEIVGVLSVTHYLKLSVENPNNPPMVKDIMHKPYYVHQTAKLPKVLKEMRRRQMHLAVVIDEYGGTLGVVTMEDILEEIVGDIWDENDTILPDEIVTLDDNTYEVEGITTISDFFEEAEIDDFGFESAYTTMGGWAVEMLEEDPHVGDVFTWKRLSVTVLEMNENLVSRLSVVVTQRREEEEEE